MLALGFCWWKRALLCDEYANKCVFNQGTLIKLNNYSVKQDAVIKIINFCCSALRVWMKLINGVLAAFAINLARIFLTLTLTLLEASAQLNLTSMSCLKLYSEKWLRLYIYIYI